MGSKGVARISWLLSSRIRTARIVISIAAIGQGLARLLTFARGGSAVDFVAPSAYGAALFTLGLLCLVTTRQRGSRVGRTFATLLACTYTALAIDLFDSNTGSAWTSAVIAVFMFLEAVGNGPGPTVMVERDEAT